MSAAAVVTSPAPRCSNDARSARQQLAAALLKRAVLLQAVHDPVERRGVDAQLAAHFADGDPGARFDHREQLVTTAVAATGARSGGVRRSGRARTAACAAPRCRRVTRGGRRNAQALSDLLELAV